MNLKEILSNIPSGTQLTKVIAIDFGQKEGDWGCTVHGLRSENGDLIIIGTEFEKRGPESDIAREDVYSVDKNLKTNPTKKQIGVFDEDDDEDDEEDDEDFYSVDKGLKLETRKKLEDLNKKANIQLNRVCDEIDAGTHNPDAHVEEHTKNLGPCDESDYYPHEQPSSSLNKERGLGKKYPKKHRTYDHRD
jgi:hypothetical protein